MRLAEKITATVIAAFLCWGAVAYITNYPMYQMVGDTNVLTGYSTLATKMRDDAWVVDTADKWETSGSPVLEAFYLYVTEQSDVSPAVLVSNGRTLHSFCLILSVACLPLFIMSKALTVDRKHLKELQRHD